MTYEAWRISYQDSEQAARAAYAETERLQAQIDRLMLEHCPDEMTPEQRAVWERSQRMAAPPQDCRERLQAEGKPYPRSGCEACGKWAPKWQECSVLLKAETVLNLPAND